MPRIRLHIKLDSSRSLGPGKVELLEQVAALGSISAAARSLEMAYRHAWLLIADLDAWFGAPVVAARAGGRRGGGAELTELGREIVRRFREMEGATGAACAAHIRALERRRRKRPG